MLIKSCIPVIPSVDIETSLRLWVDGLGFTVDHEMRDNNKLVGCMVRNDNLSFWLNQRAGTPIKSPDYEGIRLYWTPTDIHEMRERLKALGYTVSAIQHRDYGQTEFFLVDNDGYSHCFGVATQI